MAINYTKLIGHRIKEALSKPVKYYHLLILLGILLAISLAYLILVMGALERPILLTV